MEWIIFGVLIFWIYLAIKLINEKQKTIDRLNNEHNAISKENIELRELLEVQDKLLKLKTVNE